MKASRRLSKLCSFIPPAAQVLDMDKFIDAMMPAIIESLAKQAPESAPKPARMSSLGIISLTKKAVRASLLKQADGSQAKLPSLFSLLLDASVADVGRTLAPTAHPSPASGATCVARWCAAWATCGALLGVGGTNTGCAGARVPGVVRCVRLCFALAVVQPVPYSSSSSWRQERKFARDARGLARRAQTVWLPSSRPRYLLSSSRSSARR